MNELKWEQYDLDVLVRDDNKPTTIVLELEKPTLDMISIVLEDNDGYAYGHFVLDSSVKLETLYKALECINLRCEILKQEKINGYIPKYKIAKYNTETNKYEL